MILFRGGPAGAGGSAAAVGESGEGAHSGREGGEREGIESPPLSEGGTIALRSVGRVAGRSCRPRAGITRTTGPGSPGRVPAVPALFGGECRESTVMLCSALCAPCASGPAMIRTAPLLGTGTPDQGVLHPCGLVVGVAASHVPVSRPGLSPRSVAGDPMRLCAGAYATPWPCAQCAPAGVSRAPVPCPVRSHTGTPSAVGSGHAMTPVQRRPATVHSRCRTAPASGRYTRRRGPRAGGTRGAGTGRSGAGRSCFGPPDTVSASLTGGHIV